MSLGDAELRRQAEIRLWNDRLEMLKQAGLLPEFTEPVVGLIHDKITSLEQEKKETIVADQPAPPVIHIEQPSEQPEAPSAKFVSMAESRVIDVPSVEVAQSEQRYEPEQPIVADSMESYLSDLFAPQGLKQDRPLSVDQIDNLSPPVVNVSKPSDSQVNTSHSNAQPSPASEPLTNAAIPSAAVSGDDPLQESQPVVYASRVADLEAVAPSDNSSSSPSPAISELPAASTTLAADQPPPVQPQGLLDEPVPMASVNIQTSSPSETLSSGGMGSMSLRDILPPSDGVQSLTPVESSHASVLANEKKNPTELTERRNLSEVTPVNAPREAMSPAMLERYKSIQAQQAFRDDRSDRIGQGRMPNVTPGGSAEFTKRSQDMLASSMDSANADLGALLERMARFHIMLAGHVREANRILDEGGY